MRDRTVVRRVWIWSVVAWAVLVVAAACNDSGTPTQVPTRPGLTLASDTGTCAELACRPLSDGEYAEIEENIRNGIREDDPTCYQYKDWLLRQLVDGMISVGTTSTYEGSAYTGLYHVTEQRIYLKDGLWGSPGELRATLGHESSHHFGETSEEKAENWGQFCALPYP